MKNDERCFEATWCYTYCLKEKTLCNVWLKKYLFSRKDTPVPLQTLRKIYLWTASNIFFHTNPPYDFSLKNSPISKASPPLLLGTSRDTVVSSEFLPGSQRTRHRGSVRGHHENTAPQYPPYNFCTAGVWWNSTAEVFVRLRSLGLVRLLLKLTCGESSAARGLEPRDSTAEGEGGNLCSGFIGTRLSERWRLALGFSNQNIQLVHATRRCNVLAAIF